jgi:CheY-like chemotaxis protein
MNRTVLLVEDEQNDTLLVQMIFRRLGAVGPLHCVRDAEEAICYLKGEGPYADRAAFAVPRLVLVDLNLPKTTGMLLIRWIRAQPEMAKMLIVVLTVSDRPRDIAEAYRLGADSYLIKSANPDEVADMIDGLHRFWLKHQIISQPFFKPPEPP